MLVVAESLGTIKEIILYIECCSHNIHVFYYLLATSNFFFYSMEDPPMKEYQDYAPQEQQRNGYSQPLQPAETIPMTQYQEQQPPAYQQQNSNPFKNQSQSNPFKN